MYIWLIAPNLSFDEWKLEVMWYFNLCFEYDGWWLTFPVFYLIPWVNFWLNILTLTASWRYDHCWIHLVYHLPFKSLLTCSPFSPFKGWWFLFIIMGLFSELLLSMMLIMSITILTRIFKFIYFRLIGFWALWILNYPLTFTLSLPTLNLMDWHGTKRVLSFDVWITYFSIFISIRLGNPNLLTR